MSDSVAIKSQGGDSTTQNYVGAGIFGQFTISADGINYNAYAGQGPGPAGTNFGILGIMPYACNGQASNFHDRLHNNNAATPLATQSATNATRNSADQTNFNGKGLLLHVKTANLAGAATITPRLQWKDNSGNYNTIWTAAAAITTNTDKTYQLYPGAADAGSHTESKQLVCPRTFRVVLVYSGNGTTDTIDTTCDMEILL